MDDLSRFYYQNSECPDYGRRGDPPPYGRSPRLSGPIQRLAPLPERRIIDKWQVLGRSWQSPFFRLRGRER